MAEKDINKQLEKLSERVNEGLRTKSAARAVESVYLDDGMQMSAGKNTAVGKQAIIERVDEDFIKSGFVRCEFDRKEVIQVGDIAIERTDMKGFVESGECKLDAKYLHVLKKHGDSWRVYIGIINSNK